MGIVKARIGRILIGGPGPDRLRRGFLRPGLIRWGFPFRLGRRLRRLRFFRLRDGFRRLGFFRPGVAQLSLLPLRPGRGL